MSAIALESAAPAIPAGITKRRVVLPVAIFLFAFALFAAAIAAAMLSVNLGAKISFALLAGVFIANLAIIGHDAVHRSFTRVKWLNRVIGTVAFLPALHPYGRWEHHHNHVHHRFTSQIGIDNAFSPMTVEQYRAASPMRRAYYRFMRSIWGQPFFYMVDVWWPNMFFPRLKDAAGFKRTDWIDLFIVYAWMFGLVFGLAALLQRAGESFGAALENAALFGFLIPFLTWNLFISFVTIVQHTSPKVHWMLPTGRPSTHEERLRGTVHVGFPEVLDWFFHRVMQHLAHHVNPIIPLYALKAAEKDVIAETREPVIERWTPLYHWRLARDCKLYDVARDCWCDFDFQPTPRGKTVSGALAAAR